MIRVGFLLNFNENWLGGLNYFKNLLNALSEISDIKIQPVIFVGRKADKRVLAEFNALEIIETPILDRGNVFKVIRKIDKKLFCRDRLIDMLMRKYEISVISHLTEFIGRLDTPVIGWIPDFQHLHLPNMFTNRELVRRDYTFKQMCTNYNAIIVSSYDARKDLHNFAPEYSSKAHVLQFVTEPPLSENEPSLQQIEGIYHFAAPFFYVPNQFWQHKNHLTILQALNLLRKKGRDVLVVSTGSTEDYRNPRYYEELNKYINTNGLSHMFKILGKVPYSHVLSLARNCKAFINPSLFEGWSTTVEEAKSLGKRIILSDIPVHKEQDPGGGNYFNPNSPEELAEIMWQVWNDNSERDLILINEAKQKQSQRRQAFAKKYEEIVLSSLYGITK